jgi:hypothetical protein
MSFVAFDMEIATPVPDGTDLLLHRPGIACAALAREGDAQPLGAAVDRGETIVTWNGAGFDFRLLADETGRHSDCTRLALNSVDMMFQVLCDRGHPLALDSALRGMELPSKVHEVTLGDGQRVHIDGVDAPRLWQEGEYRAVMDYCAGDVSRTLALAVACQQRQRLAWFSQRGRRNELRVGPRWLTVKECLALPVPDTSWMDRPILREGVVAWMGHAGIGDTPPRSG